MYTSDRVLFIRLEELIKANSGHLKLLELLSMNGILQWEVCHHGTGLLHAIVLSKKSPSTREVVGMTVIKPPAKRRREESRLPAGANSSSKPLWRIESRARNSRTSGTNAVHKVFYSSKTFVQEVPSKIVLRWDLWGSEALRGRRSPKEIRPLCSTVSKAVASEL